MIERGSTYKAKYIFAIVITIVVFIPLLTQKYAIFNFWDEIIAALAIPLMLYRLFTGKLFKIRLSSFTRSYRGWLFIFVLSGLIGTIMYKYQPFFGAALPDLFLNIKFWLAIYWSSYVFKKLDVKKCSKIIGQLIRFVVIVFVLLYVLDRIFNFFSGDYRFGIKSAWLFYEIHSYFAAVCVFLIGVLTVFKEHITHYWVYTSILLMFMILTFRSKAFGGVILFLFLYFIIYKFRKKLNLRTIVLMGIPIFLIGWPQIQVYFLSTEERARAVLLVTSIKIMREYFPIGTGFATFASYYSGKVYSPLYIRYGINNVLGLAEGHATFVSDSFWPMIFAQNGFIGTVMFLMALYMLFRKIQFLRKFNINYYFGAMFCFMYLCVTSLAESAFVHPMSVPMGVLMGLCLTQAERKPI